MRVIFVAGIHAVGKSTACKSISDEFGMPHYSASQIIRDEKSSAISADSKLVTDVSDNQRLLIQGVSRLLKDGRFFLDGHFTIRRKSDGGIEAIHVDVFRELRINSIVLLTDLPEDISNRMHDRDGVLHHVDMIRTHQDAEVAHASYVASTLNIPLVELRAFDIAGIKSVIKNWLV